jgi:hypothetical protein
MKVRIGSFDEGYAMELVEALKSAGIGVEVRRFIDVDYHTAYFVEGRFSELKNKYEETELIDEIKRWKMYLDFARDVKNFEELEKKILDELVPDRDKAEIDEELMRRMFDAYFTLGILLDMLDLNGAIEGDEIKNLPEDPIIRFPYDADEDKANKLDLKQKLVVSAEVTCDVYADLGDALFEMNELVELCKKNDELIGLLLTVNFAEAILEKIGDRKVDIKELLANMRRVEFGENIEFRAPSDVIEAILEALEKAKLVKIKKGKVSLIL